MSDATGLVSAMKRAAVDAVEAAKPAEARYGVVDTVSPLSIEIEQKLTIDEAQLVVFKGAAFSAGDKVVLLREQGGQKYIILGVIE